MPKEIKRTLRVIYKDRLVLVLSVLSGLLLLGSGLLLLFRPIDYSDLSVLHTNVYVGIDALGSWRWLYILPLLTLLFSALNFILAFWLWTRQRLWAYHFLAVTVGLDFFVLYYLYNILYFNLR